MQEIDDSTCALLAVLEADFRCYGCEGDDLLTPSLDEWSVLRHYGGSHTRAYAIVVHSDLVPFVKRITTKPRSARVDLEVKRRDGYPDRKISVTFSHLAHKEQYHESLLEALELIGTSPRVFFKNVAGGLECGPKSGSK